MLEAFETRVIAAVPGAVEAMIPNALGLVTAGPLMPVAPQTWTGRSASKGYGLAMVITVRAGPVPGGIGVQATIGAELDTVAIIVGVLLLVLFWPAAVIVGFLAHDDFTKRRTQAFQLLWQRLGAPYTPSFGGYPPAPPPPPPPGFSGRYG